MVGISKSIMIREWSDLARIKSVSVIYCRMTDFGDTARQFARRLSYTEYDAEEMTKRRVKAVGDYIADELAEPRLDELCQKLDLDTSNLDNPAVAFTAQDVALAGWSNWGAGSFDRAVRQSELTEGEFIVLNDYFDDVYRLAEGD